MALCSRCFQFCFGRKKESDIFPKSEFLENQAITIRRISSVGQTVIDENGEEKEIPRHSSILKSYNDVPIPWTSTPLSIQPGVTKEDVMNRIKALPTIVEVAPKPKQKGWRKALKKKDNYSPLKAKEKSEKNVQTALFSPILNMSKSTEVIPLKIEKQDTKILSILRRGSYGSSPNLSSVEAGSEDTTSNYTLASSINSDKFENKLLTPLTNRWLHSQSMEDVNNMGSLTAAELAKRYGLDITMYTEPLDYPLLNQKSGTEIENLYIAKSEGRIELIVSFHESDQLLTVFVKQIKGLSGAGPSKEAFSPMLKLSIQGEKKQIKNEKKIAPNLNPTVNQYFTLYVKDKESKTLRISIFNSNFLGRNDAVGHGHLSLKGIKDDHSCTVKIQRPSYIGNCPALLDMTFFFESGVFQLNLNRIFSIATKFKKYKLISKLSHYSNSKKVKEKVNNIPFIEDDSNESVLNHSIKFKVDTSGLKHDYILISIKTADQAIFKKHDKALGRFYLGPGFYYEDNSLTPWGRAILHEEKINYSFKLYL